MKINNIELTPEMQEKLKEAGALGFTIENKFKYVPRVYREKVKGKYVFDKRIWPVFELRSLNGLESTELQDEMTGKVTYDSDNKPSVDVRTGRTKITILELGLLSWVNFFDENGKVIPSRKKDINIEESLKRIQPALITELANAITERSVLTEEELLGLE